MPPSRTCDSRPLRLLVEKWLAVAAGLPSGTTRIVAARRAARHCVCVEAILPGGPVQIFFFRHADLTWQVFPPERTRPSMCVDRPIPVGRL